MQVLTLPTTLHFFERVLSGVKTTEYRRDIPYYREKFREPARSEYRYLVLHYRHPRFLVCQIRRIRYVVKPRALSSSVFITTPRCFAIDIQKVVGETRSHSAALQKIKRLSSK